MISSEIHKDGFNKDMIIIEQQADKEVNLLSTERIKLEKENYDYEEMLVKNSEKQAIHTDRKDADHKVNP